MDKLIIDILELIKILGKRIESLEDISNHYRYVSDGVFEYENKLDEIEKKNF